MLRLSDDKRLVSSSSIFLLPLEAKTSSSSDFLKTLSTRLVLRRSADLEEYDHVDF
jgi:hypothetical protein